MPLFSGEYASTIDDKNRIIIPADLRKAAGREGEAGYYVTRGFENCIVIQTAARFESTNAAAADERLRHTAAGRMLERAIFSRARFAQCDKQGRLRIPPTLTEKLDIGRSVVIVGLNDRIEVWDEAEWADVIEQAEQQLVDRAEEYYGGPGKE
ncbi:MAG: division/cell wall cluster transcriptional repressor MraZ [bacterium]